MSKLHTRFVLLRSSSERTHEDILSMLPRRGENTHEGLKSTLCSCSLKCSFKACACLPVYLGYYCAEHNLTAPNGPCYAGFYCPLSANRPDYIICPEGYFCGNTSYDPSPCRAGGYFCPRGGGDGVCAFWSPQHIPSFPLHESYHLNKHRQMFLQPKIPKQETKMSQKTLHCQEHTRIVLD